MLSVTSHQLMQAVPDYHLDDRPTKRIRPEEELYPIPGPSIPPETESGDGSAKRNRKRPLSCGECRRLKLKCDRVFPCQSCCKRGCAEICPDGALIGGKGSRFILANTEQLHEKIKAMAERIRQLEDGLGTIQSQHSTEPHPLLQPELLTIKRSPELFGVERNGQSGPHSDSGRSHEDDHHGSSSSSPRDIGLEFDTGELVSTSAMSTSLGLPYDIAKLSRSCPVPKSVHTDLDPQLRQRIRDMLPPRHEGQRLCEQAQLNAFWHYSPDTSESFLPNLIHSVYTTPLDALLPHRLSLFLMILAIGAAVDLSPNRDPQAAERYHHLARAAVCETAVIDDPSFDTINTLFYEIWYLLMFSNHKRAAEHAWGIMGLLAKLAHSLSLHREGAVKMIPEELDKRKALLWNMMNVDVRLALMLRRPPSLCIQHVDVKRPAYMFDTSGSGLNLTAIYHGWRDAFLAQCQYPVLEMIVSPQQPAYTDVLDLDAMIRNYEVPQVLRMVDNAGVVPPHPLSMQQVLTLCTREVALLNLHRGFFTQALSITEGFTVRHRYAPSVLATYGSISNYLWAVQTCYKWQPELTLRFAALWHNVLSGGLALCLLLGRAPSCPLCPHVNIQLDNVRSLFMEVRDRCPVAAKALLPLEACVARARSVYIDWCRGSIDRFSETPKEDDEICILARRAGLVPEREATVVPPPEDPNPFELAHPSLRRCYEQFIAKVPSTFVDPLPGQLESMTQAYSTSAERTMHVDDLNGGKDPSSAQTVYNAGLGSGLGSEFTVSSWMTYF